MRLVLPLLVIFASIGVAGWALAAGYVLVVLVAVVAATVAASGFVAELFNARRGEGSAIPPDMLPPR